MYHIKDDRRSIRSSEMIYEGLVKLMDEKSFDRITVTDLVNEAKVGRTTFYRHFDEIEDVLWLRCDQVVNGLTDYLHAYHHKHQEESPTRVLKPLLRYFYLHSELIELLMKAKRTHIFEAVIYRHFEPHKSMFSTFFGVEEDYVDYIMLARIGSLTNILTHWIATGKQQAPDELAYRIRVILSDMIALEHWL